MNTMHFFSFWAPASQHALNVCSRGKWSPQFADAPRSLLPTLTMSSPSFPATLSAEKIEFVKSFYAVSDEPTSVDKVSLP